MNNILSSYRLVALLLCCLGGISTSAKAQRRMFTNSDLKAFLGPIPLNIDPSSITSFTEYVVIQQLTRGLVHLDSSGQLSGDIAEHWKIEKNSTQFYFKLKENQKFSNNDPLTAKDVVGTIQRQLKKGQTIHFDFTNIKNIRAISSSEIEILTAKPDHLFISKLTYPEFGILHENDYSKPLTQQCEWKITSGHTTLIKKTKTEIVLEQSDQTKRKINIANETPDQSALKNSSIDFFVGIPPLTDEQHKYATSAYLSYSPRLAFTYFLSFGKNSNFLKDRKLRTSIVSKLYEFRKNLKLTSPFHSLAQQLYLADGPGRTSPAKISEIRANHLKYADSPSDAKKLILLVQKSFPYTKELTSFLASIGFELELYLYANFDEFDKIRKSKKIDLIQSNNDFSAADLTSNLMVTMNDQRPLIETEDTSIMHSIIKKLKSESDDNVRISAIQNAEEQLLLEAYVFPLFHFNMYFYVSKQRDSRNLSRSFPEVALWKIK